MPATPPLAGPIVVVEDTDEDFETLSWAMQRLAIEHPVIRCSDGDEALDLIYHRGRYADLNGQDAPRPALVLLDLNLSAVDGRDVLTVIKQDESVKDIPVVVWTTSAAADDVALCYERGANSYMIKPMHLDKLLNAVKLLQLYWLRVVILPQGKDEGAAH